jgi:hypothetical protein
LRNWGTYCEDIGIDIRTGNRWLTQSAEASNADAQDELGLMFAGGSARPVDGGKGPERTLEHKCPKVTNVDHATMQREHHCSTTRSSLIRDRIGRCPTASGTTSLLLLWRGVATGRAYRGIPLTQGKFALVDPEDYADLVGYKWCAAKQGRTFYAVCCAAGVQIRMHRVITNAGPGQVCDHINHDGLDDMRSNLRLCSRRENGRNQQRRTGGTSRYKGVTWHKGDRKWHARIYHNGRCHHLGAFASEIAAAQAYDRAALALYGEFACLDFPRRASLRAMVRRGLFGRKKRA